MRTLAIPALLAILAVAGCAPSEEEREYAIEACAVRFVEPLPADADAGEREDHEWALERGRYLCGEMDEQLLMDEYGR